MNDSILINPIRTRSVSQVGKTLNVNPFNTLDFDPVSSLRETDVELSQTGLYW